MTGRKGYLVLIGLAVIFFATAAVYAVDWPQWQGHNRDGKSADTGHLKQWPDNGPAIAWKIGELGGGDSGSLHRRRTHLRHGQSRQ